MNMFHVFSTYVVAKSYERVRRSSISFRSGVCPSSWGESVGKAQININIHADMRTYILQKEICDKNAVVCMPGGT